MAEGGEEEIWTFTGLNLAPLCLESALSATSEGRVIAKLSVPPVLLDAYSDNAPVDFEHEIAMLQLIDMERGATEKAQPEDGGSAGLVSPGLLQP